MPCSVAVKDGHEERRGGSRRLSRSPPLGMDRDRPAEQLLLDHGRVPRTQAMAQRVVTSGKWRGSRRAASRLCVDERVQRSP